MRSRKISNPDSLPDDILWDELTATVECLLFASGEPLRIGEMARICDCAASVVTSALEQLAERYETTGSGLQILEIAGGWQLSTRPQYAVSVGRLILPNAHRLTRPALETITIIAYRQPCTVADIEAIRGVACAGVLKTLEQRGLIQESGRRSTPGRPILYTTTDYFLHHFGMKGLSDLPQMEEESASETPFDAKSTLNEAGMTIADG